MPYRFGSRRALGALSPLEPSNLPFLELRLSGKTLAGQPDDPVATWTDTSGNGRDATGGPNLPALSGDSAANPNSPTGRLGVWFNSAFNVYMTGSLPVGGLEPSRGFTAYAWFHGGGTNAAHEQALWEPTASGARLVYADGSAFIGFVDFSGTHASAVSRSTGYHSLVYVFNPVMGVGQARIYHQGSLILESDWGFTNGLGPKAGYTLANNTVTTTPFEGIFYEFNLFSQAHSLNTIQRVLQYGKQHWGI